MIALARKEAQLMLRHPAVLLGTALCAWLVVVTQRHTQGWRVDSVNVVLAMVPLGWLTLVAGSQAALRTRRDRVEELFAATPTAAPARTAGILVGCIAAAGPAVAVLGWWAAHRQLTLAPGGGLPDVAELAVAPLIVVGGGVVGVAVARWLPHPLMAIPAIVITGVMAVNMATSATAPSRYLSFWSDASFLGIDALDPRPKRWHLAWLGAWVMLMAVAALVRHAASGRWNTASLGEAGMLRPLLAVAGLAALAAVIAGWAQVQGPTPAQLDEMVAVLHEPEGHQVCASHNTVTACAYPDHRDLLPTWIPVLERVVEATPAAHRRPLIARQRVPTIIGNPHCADQPALAAMHPDLRRRINPEKVWAADGLVHPSPVKSEALPCEGPSVDWLFTAVQAGAWAVGLPPAPSGLDSRCAADGQARAALALYLGAQAVPRGQSALALVSEQALWSPEERIGFGAADGRMNAGWNGHPQWGVAWHRDDVLAAVRLLGVDKPVMREILDRHWARLVSPTTSTAELLTLAGAPPIAGLPAPSGGCIPIRSPLQR